MRLTAKKGNCPFGKFLFSFFKEKNKTKPQKVFKKKKKKPSLRNIPRAGVEHHWLDGNEDSDDFHSHCGMNLSKIIRELAGFLGDFMGLSQVGDSERRGTSNFLDHFCPPLPQG